MTFEGDGPQSECDEGPKTRAGFLASGLGGR